MFHSSSPGPPVPGPAEVAEARRRLTQGGLWERSLLETLYPDAPLAWALAMRDSDGDGTLDFRISELHGRFLEGDVDLDGDGLDNVHDPNPFVAGDTPRSGPARPLPGAAWAARSAELAALQQRLLDSHGILLVDRTRRFTPGLAQVVEDVVSRVLPAHFDGISPGSLRVVATEDGPLADPEAPEGAEDLAQFVPASRTIELYAPLIDAPPLVQLLVLVHEVMHAVQIDMDFSEQDQRRIEQRNLVLADEFHALVERWGWTRDHEVREPSVQYTLLRPHHAYERPWSYEFDRRPALRWKGALSALAARQDGDDPLSDPAFAVLELPSVYAVEDPFEWHSEHAIAWLLLELVEAASAGCTEDERAARVRHLERTVLAPFWAFRAENARQAPVRGHFRSTYPLTSAGLEFLVERYLMPTRMPRCAPRAPG
jgi:hypothetical protein